MDDIKILNKIIKKISKLKFDRNSKFFDLLDSIQLLRLIVLLEEKNLKLNFSKLKRNEKIFEVAKKIKKLN